MEINNIKNEIGMTLIVKTVTRLTVGLILLYGIYLIFNGHSSPGGGFAGGVIIALSFIHIMLAFGKDMALKKLTVPFARVMISAGALIFLSVAMLGFTKGAFFLNTLFRYKMPFNLFSEGSIPLYEVAIGLMVGGALFLMFVTLVLMQKVDRDLEKRRK